MLRRIFAGAAAGVIATGPQSAVVWGARAAGIYDRRPPPEAVADTPTTGMVEAGVLPANLKRPAMIAGSDRRRGLAGFARPREP